MQTCSGIGVKALRGLFSIMYPVSCNNNLQTMGIGVFENKLLIFIRHLHKRRQAGNSKLRQLYPDKESLVPTVRPAARGVQLGAGGCNATTTNQLHPPGIFKTSKASMLIGSQKNLRNPPPYPHVAFVESRR
jgi:hypothetical protein